MASYATQLTSPGIASDGTTQPAGTIINIILWDGESPYTPHDFAGNTNNVELVLFANGIVVYSPPPTPTTQAEVAAGLLANGVTVTSANNSALNGIYPADDETQANINAISTFVLVNPGEFPSGSSQVFLDLAGEPHVFTSTVEWQAFASAMAKCVALLKLYAAGATNIAPNMEVTIP